MTIIVDIVKRWLGFGVVRDEDDAYIVIILGFIIMRVLRPGYEMHIDFMQSQSRIMSPIGTEIEFEEWIEEAKPNDDVVEDTQ